MDEAGGGHMGRPHDLRVAVLAWIPAALIFFRHAFTSGFDQIGGDGGDVRLIVVLHEHWYRVLQGEVAWNRPSFFHPATDVLGYTDTFFVDTLLYAPLRAAGLDMFAAFQWTVILLSLVGFASVFLVCTRLVGTGRLQAALLSTAFVFSNHLYIKQLHPQLYAVYLVPPVILLAARSLREPRPWPRRGWAAAAGLLFGSIIYSSYYLGWFVVLAAIVIGVVLTVIGWARFGFMAWLRAGRRFADQVVAFGTGFAVMMIPFAITYYPVLRRVGGRGYDEAMFYAPGPGDLLNLGEANFLWNGVLRNLLPMSQERLVDLERSLALTPVLVAATLAAGVVSAVVGRRRAIAARATRSAGSPTPAPAAVAIDRPMLGLALALSAVILVLMPVRFGIGSLWRIPFTLLPGAVGVRAIGRVNIVAALVAVLAIGIGLTLLRPPRPAPRVPRSARPRRSWVPLALVALLGVIALEQLNTADLAGIDRSEEILRLVSVPDPPGGCEAFYVDDTSGFAGAGHLASIQAMLLSQVIGLPTINGYDGQYPADFSALNPGHPGYLDSVAYWAEINGLDALCAYDEHTGTWTGPGVP